MGPRAKLNSRSGADRKGTTNPMKKSVYVLAVVLSVSALWGADAFTGTWKLNPGKSKFEKGKEIREITVVMTEQGANSAVTAKGVQSDGKAISVRYTMPMKGGPMNFTEGGPAAGTAVVAKRVDANTVETTSMLNGKEVGSTRTTVSKDGKTLTRTAKTLDDKGKAVMSTAVLDRQ